MINITNETELAFLSRIILNRLIDPCIIFKRFCFHDQNIIKLNVRSHFRHLKLILINLRIIVLLSSLLRHLKLFSLSQSLCTICRERSCSKSVSRDKILWDNHWVFLIICKRHDSYENHLRRWNFTEAYFRHWSINNLTLILIYDQHVFQIIVLIILNRLSLGRLMLSRG